MMFDIIATVNTTWNRSPWVDYSLAFSISEDVFAFQLQLNEFC